MVSFLLLSSDSLPAVSRTQFPKAHPNHSAVRVAIAAAPTFLCEQICVHGCELGWRTGDRCAKCAPHAGALVVMACHVASGGKHRRTRLAGLGVISAGDDEAVG